jgi:glycosyltransferase involved in cell wall biosynthesis
MVTAYLPHLGVHAGGGRMFHFIRRLARKHRITLLTFLENEDEKRFLTEVEKYCVRAHAIVRPRRANLHVFPYEPFDEFYTEEMQHELRGLLEAHNYDLIQFEYTQMGKYAPRNTAMKMLLTEHEINFAAHYTLVRHTGKPLAKIKRFYDHLQVMNREVEICKRMDKVICVTARDAGEISGYVPPEKIVVVNTGVDLSYFRPDPAPEEPWSLVFVGAFQHYPNVDGMLYFCESILPLIRKEIPEVKIYIVGSNPKDEIRRLAQDASIVVTGFVPDTRPYMARSAVYVVPLRLGVGIRGKILEAWGMGKAVVATPLACAGLDVTDGENIFMADASQLFAERVIYLLKNPDARKQLSARALATVQQYDWEVVAEKLEKLYYEVLR